MASLLEMAADIVAAHASTTTMTKEELITELADLHKTLIGLEKGEATVADVSSEAVAIPTITVKKAFGKDKITCMICGKEMKTLARHLKTVHNLKPGEYRKQFGIPRTQALAARAYSESRKELAIARGLGDKLAQARTAKAAKSGKASKPAKAAKPETTANVAKKVSK